LPPEKGDPKPLKLQGYSARELALKLALLELELLELALKAQGQTAQGQTAQGQTAQGQELQILSNLQDAWRSYQLNNKRRPQQWHRLLPLSG
jgi:hypothetical protein